jgi:hypothetical protein
VEQPIVLAAGHVVVAAGGFIEVSANVLGWIKALTIAAGGVAALVSIVATFIATRGNIYKTIGAGIAAGVLVFLLANFATSVTFAKGSWEEAQKKPPVDAGVNTGGIGG